MSKYTPDRMYLNKQYMEEFHRLQVKFFREITIPIREFKCPTCGKTFESYCALSDIPETRPCQTPLCKGRGELVAFSRPAKRNPAHGIQK